jgi:hypothetical protein
MVLKRAGRLPWETLLRHPHWLTRVLGLLREFASSMPPECLCGHSNWLSIVLQLWSGELMLRRLLLTAHKILGGALLAHCHWLPHILVRLPRHWRLLLTADEMLGGWLSHISVPRHWLLLVAANGMMEGALLAHCHWLSHVLVRLPRHWLVRMLLVAANRRPGRHMLPHVHWLPEMLVASFGKRLLHVLLRVAKYRTGSLLARLHWMRLKSNLQQTSARSVKANVVTLTGDGN